MGLKQFMAQILLDIGRQYGPSKTNEEKDALWKRLDVKYANSGFCAIRAVVVCPCGNPVKVQAMAPEHDEVSVAEYNAAGGGDHVAELVMAAGSDATEGSPTVHACNNGYTASKCSECGAQFISCWEMDSVQIAKDVVLPRHEPDVPEHAASGWFRNSDGTNETVH
jgi:hypothetical protein